MQSSSIEVVTVAEVAILEENLSALSDILQIALVLFVPRIGIGFHQAAHALFHDIGVAILLIVLPFRVDTIGTLRGLQHVGLAMHLCTGWRGRMHGPKLDRLF